MVSFIKMLSLFGSILWEIQCVSSLYIYLSLFPISTCIYFSLSCTYIFLFPIYMYVFLYLPFIATPVIQRESQTDILVSPGGTLTLYCIADCKPPPPSYQWYFNNDPMPYQTNCTLTVTNCHQGSHNGFYHCCVTNTAIDNKRQSTVRSRGTNVEITSVPIQGTVYMYILGVEDHIYLHVMHDV